MANRSKDTPNEVRGLASVALTMLIIVVCLTPQTEPPPRRKIKLQLVMHALRRGGWLQCLVRRRLPGAKQGNQKSPQVQFPEMTLLSRLAFVHWRPDLPPVRKHAAGLHRLAIAHMRTKYHRIRGEAENPAIHRT